MFYIHNSEDNAINTVTFVSQNDFELTSEELFEPNI